MITHISESTRDHKKLTRLCGFRYGQIVPVEDIEKAREWLATPTAKALWEESKRKGMDRAFEYAAKQYAALEAEEEAEEEE